MFFHSLFWVSDLRYPILLSFQFSAAGEIGQFLKWGVKQYIPICLCIKNTCRWQVLFVLKTTKRDYFLPRGSVLTATGATNGLFLGDPAFFGFGNKPALSPDIT